MPTPTLQNDPFANNTLGRPISRGRQRLGERAIFAVLVGCGLFTLCMTLVIFVTIFSETITFFGLDEVSVVDFLTSTTWSPLLGNDKQFGIWPLISGTFLVSFVAMCIALPLGLITAIWLSEYASHRMRSLIKPVLEVLAGIPTVVFGFFALMIITPFLVWLHEQLLVLLGLPTEDAIAPGEALHWLAEGFGTYNATSAGIAVGIMCLPTVISLTEDALHAVPRALREGAYGLGATRLEVSLKVVVPAALSGLTAAFLLAVARAVGETMIVSLAAGNSPQLTVDPRQEVQTMTGYMVQVLLGDTSNFGPEYYSSYAVAAVLFTLTLMLTILGHFIRKRFTQKYE